MRFRKKDEKNFLKVGLFISVLTVVLAVLIVSIGKENSFFEKKINIRARVPSVSNLRPGSYVELKGIRIGTVEGIRIASSDEVEIQLTILESHLKWIKQDSLVSISTAGLVGDKFLEVFNGTNEAPPFDPKNDILKSESATDLKQFISKGESIATVTERIVNRIDILLSNFDEGKKLFSALDAFEKSARNFEIVTKELKEAQLANTAKTIGSAMSRMDRVLSRIESGPGSMNSIIYDDGLHDDLRAVLGGASRNKVIKYFIRESIKNSERKKLKSDN